MNRLVVLLKKFRRKLLQVVVEVVRVIGVGTVRLGAPSGTYSILEDPSAVSIVVKGQTPISAQPGSLRDISRLAQDKNQPWPIFWVRLPQARLVGENLSVLNDQKKMMVENLYGPDHYRSNPDYNYLYLPPTVQLDGPWTSVIGRWCGYFAHWMLDALPRLALLDRFPGDTRILVPATLLPAQRESLEILGLIERCRPTAERHLLVEDYYFSSFTAMTGCDNPYAFQFMRDKFLQAAAPAARAGDKIYISRRGAARAPIEEEEMIEFLEGEGWTIIQAEKYSLREQIGIFRQARAVCSIHGAGLTHLLWCDPGCKVLELCAANYLNGSLETLALCLGLNHRFLVFPADRKFRITVDMDKFKSAIKALA